MMSLLSYMFEAIQGGSWGGLLVAIALSAFNIFALVNTTLPYLRGQQTGTITLSAEQVASMGTVSNEYQTYTITGSEMYDTGIETLITMEGAETARVYYGVLKVGDYFLLVDRPTPIDESVLTYTGRFDDYQFEDVLGKMSENYPEVKQRLLMIYFSETRDHTNSSMQFILSVQALLFLITIYALWRFFDVTVFRNG